MADTVKQSAQYVKTETIGIAPTIGVTDIEIMTVGKHIIQGEMK